MLIRTKKFVLTRHSSLSYLVTLSWELPMRYIVFLSSLFCFINSYQNQLSLFNISIKKFPPKTIASASTTPPVSFSLSWLPWMSWYHQGIASRYPSLVGITTSHDYHIGHFVTHNISSHYCLHGYKHWKCRQLDSTQQAADACSLQNSHQLWPSGQLTLLSKPTAVSQFQSSLNQHHTWMPPTSLLTRCCHHFHCQGHCIMMIHTKQIIPLWKEFCLQLVTSSQPKTLPITPPSKDNTTDSDGEATTQRIAQGINNNSTFHPYIISANQTKNIIILMTKNINNIQCLFKESVSICSLQTKTKQSVHFICYSLRKILSNAHPNTPSMPTCPLWR